MNFPDTVHKLFSANICEWLPLAFFVCLFTFQSCLFGILGISWQVFSWRINQTGLTETFSITSNNIMLTNHCLTYKSPQKNELGMSGLCKTRHDLTVGLSLHSYSTRQKVLHWTFLRTMSLSCCLHLTHSLLLRSPKVVPDGKWFPSSHPPPK